MAGDGGTRYNELTPGVGAPQVAMPGGPVRQDVAQAGAGFKALGEFGKEATGYVDRLQEIADLNTLAQKTSEHGLAASEATHQWQNGLTGTDPKADLAAHKALMDTVDSKILEGVSGRAAQLLKNKLALHRPVFYEAANKAVDAAGKQATLTTGAGLAETTAKTAMQMPSAAARDALFGDQVGRFYAAQVAAGSISAVEEAQYVKHAWDNFQFQIAKNQAEVAPSLFLAGIRKGPNGEPSEWEKRLTPEALNQLGPAIKRAQGDSTLLTVADQFRGKDGVVNWRGVAAYAADPKNKPADTPADQWEQVLHSAQNRLSMQRSAQEFGRAQSARAGIARLAEAYLAGTPEAFEGLARDLNSDPHTRETAARAYQTLQNKGNIPLYVDTANRAVRGDIDELGIQQLVGPGGLTPVQANNAIKKIDSVSPADKIAIGIRVRAFREEVKDPEMRKQFETVFRQTLAAGKIKGEEDIMRVGDDLVKDTTSWYQPYSGAYQKKYQEMMQAGGGSSGGLGTQNSAAPGAPIQLNPGGTLEDRAGAYLRGSNYPVTPANIKWAIDGGKVK